MATSTGEQQREQQEQADGAGPSQPMQTTSHFISRRPKTNIVRAAQLDVLQLLVRFLLNARDGTALTFSVFKDTWKQLSFSYIFKACPYHIPLPDFISSLFIYLLDIIKLASLPQQQALELAADPTTDPTADQPEQQEERNEENSSSSSSKVAALSTADIHWTLIHFSQGPFIQAAAVYCLHCLYYAQPGPVSVRIRIPEERQQSIHALPPSLAQVNAVEALMVLRQLVQDHALLPSSLQRPVAQLESGAAGAGAGGGAFVPGAGAAYLTPGLKSEEASTLREVRFHLDSTLSGLGTAHLNPLCHGYGEKVKRMWAVLGQHGKNQDGKEAPLTTTAVVQKQKQQKDDGDDDAPEFVSDLSLGRWIHEYTVEKQKEMRIVLQQGPNWRAALGKKKAKRGRPQSAATIAAAAAAAAQEEDEQRQRQQQQQGGAGGSRRATATGSKRRRTSSSSKRDKKDGGADGGVPALARRIEARENSRKADIARRSQPWAARLGVQNLAEVPPGANGGGGGGGDGTMFFEDDFEDDMPQIPGVASLFGHLTGRSTHGGGGGGGGGGVSGGESTMNQNRNNNGSTTTNSDSDSSSSSDSSDSDVDSSEEEEEERETGPSLAAGAGENRIGTKRVRSDKEQEEDGSKVAKRSNLKQQGKDSSGTAAAAVPSTTMNRSNKRTTTTTRGKKDDSQIDHEKELQFLRDVRAELTTVLYEDSLDLLNAQ